MSDPTPGPAPALDIRVVAGAPDEYELAAVAAVLQAIAEEAGSRAEPRERTAPPSRWQESRRNLRGPLPSRWV